MIGLDIENTLLLKVGYILLHIVTFLFSFFKPLDPDHITNTDPNPGVVEYGFGSTTLNFLDILSFFRSVKRRERIDIVNTNFFFINGFNGLSLRPLKKKRYGLNGLTVNLSIFWLTELELTDRGG